MFSKNQTYIGEGGDDKDPDPEPESQGLFAIVILCLGVNGSPSFCSIRQLHSVLTNRLYQDTCIVIFT